MVALRARRRIDCFCHNGVLCPPCVVALAVAFRIAHPTTLSVAMLRRRIPGITGHEAVLLVEATKYIPMRRLSRD